MSKAFGAKFLGYFQPMAHYKEPLHGREQRYTGADNPEYTVSRRARVLIRRELAAASARGALDAHDLSDIYNGYEGPVFSDSVHTFQAPMMVIADRMAKDVKRVLFGAAAPAPAPVPAPR